MRSIFTNSIVLRRLPGSTRVCPGLIFFLLILAPLLIPVPVSAQGFREITGTVVSTDGDSLALVTVSVKNSNLSVLTDEKGQYSIRVSELRPTLVFSFVGYENQETVVNGSSTIDASLTPTNGNLNSVVVVGYGTQKKANVTGSVATISARELSVVPAANVSTLMYGNLPGLIPVQRSGQPGNDDVSLSIRGFSNALVVVDGIVGRDLNRLDPNEIESITVLKDASSAAVYGVSGGNGVIVVTTKKGKLGKPEFNYTMNYGVQTVTRYPRLVNSEEFAILKNEASVNIGGAPVYTDEEIEKYRLGTDPNYPNFDYYDYFVRDYTPQRQQNISVRGGSEKIKYFFLLGEIKQESMWEGGNQDYAKYNFRSNVSAQINDDLEIAIDFGARSDNRNNLVQDSYLMASWLQYQWPIYNPKTPDGKMAATNYALSAYLDKDLTGYLQNDRNAFQGTLNINYKIPFVDGLSVRITAARDLLFENQKFWQKQYGLYSYNTATQTSEQTGARDLNQLVLNEWRSSATRLQGSLNYSRTFLDRHNLKALLLYEEMEDRATDFSATRINYVVPIDQIFAGPDLNKNNGGGASDNGRQSVVGRLNYDFSGKYLFEYSFRYDGSARFPVDKRWGFFSGVSAGWRISEEKFFRDNVNAINNLKLRASWGQNGRDSTGNFQFLTGYSYPSGSYILGGNVVTNGMEETGLPNPNITWELTRMLNIGLDLSMWNRLLELEADVFHRTRNGLLAQRNLQLPSTFGANLPFENLNSDDTKGFELVLRHNHQIRKIRYTISANVSFTKSKWDHFEQREFTSQDDNWRNNVEGRWQNRFFGLKAVGQFQSQEDINTSPIQDARQNSTLRPGDIKYDDLNGDGVIDTYDSQPIGRGETPEINYGLGINVGWKNLSVSMNWQGASNFNVNQTDNLIAPFNNDMSSYAYFMDRWHRADSKDPNSEWIPGKYPSTINNGAPNNRLFSSFWLKDATYLRLRALNISYSIDAAPLKRIGIKSLALSVSGYNLITITGLDYIDPEAPSGRLSYYPQQKTYNAGINLTF